MTESECIKYESINTANLSENRASTDLAHNPQSIHYPIETKFNSFIKPQLCFHTSNEFQNQSSNNFTIGVKVSPDGLCMLTNSNDHILRLFEYYNNDISNSPTIKSYPSTLQFHEGGSVYDYTWYPLMNSNDPNSCIFISTSQDHPTHMWDAYSGNIRATYRAYNHLDEITTANSIAFNTTGSHIFMGFDRVVRSFDITQPGRTFTERRLCATKRSKYGQRGIISCLHFNPDHSKIYAAGSYSGSTCIYMEDSGEEIMCLRDHDGHGITQAQFSPNGMLLTTSARKDNRLQVWDIRRTQNILYTLYRESNETNQKIEFDYHPTSKYLASGSLNGCVLMYNLHTGELENQEIQLPDTANGVSFFPDPQVVQIAVSSGQRYYDLPNDMIELNESDARSKSKNRLEVYKFV